MYERSGHECNGYYGGMNTKEFVVGVTQFRVNHIKTLCLDVLIMCVIFLANLMDG
jgi:hypothetical protein